jgi:glycogen debranching enzyme
MAEVQGYAYRARRELAMVLAGLGHDAEAADLVREAERLRELVRRRFWVPGDGGTPGFFALAIDGAKEQVPAVASNMGHLLWCGIPSHEEARQVAAHLTSPAMASGWGLRTLSERMEGFNPISYHVGSVWPHDTALACDGLRLYGLDDAALTLAGSLLDALAAFEDRLPELFGGHARRNHDFPVPYPTACRPQAWAAGVPLAFVSLFLGLAPRIPEGVISLGPALPPGIRSLEVRGITFPSGPLSIAVGEDGTRVIEAPPGVAIEFRARGAQTAA